MFRQRLINLDVWAGRFADLKLPAYIEERLVPEGTGAYTPEEWSRARAGGYRGAGENSRLLDTEDGYRQRLATTHAAAVATARRFAQTLDFQRYNSILELGCGEMVHGHILTGLHPQVRYRATDFDPYVIEKCSRLPLLANLEKEVLDAGRLTAADLAGFKLLVAWEMIYALDDTRLLHVLRAAAAAGVPFLAGTTQLLGPLRYGLRQLRNLDWRPAGFHYARRLRRHEIRMHGWNLSLGHYGRLAAEAGLRVTRVWAPPPAGGSDNFFLVLFDHPAPAAASTPQPA